ncbi:putative peptidase [Roseovarius litorisediminis]|uniref:Putative peptidase n=1 Tax=Roseovarius litorisediminis TaxID=1312363 RepID=A0A1Y5SCZ5_9RHOB|nr:aminopeptidase P family protein [Roseovarius litorisediminis]SLN36346.1 putative peptidase [Roseovarius litorisediminis]
MFQSFDDTASPDQGPPRLKRLRTVMANKGLAGYLVPRADAHQGEYVAPCDDRLAWLTGFTGSAGFCAVVADKAGVFVDGRYRVQAKVQVDTRHFTPVDWPEIKLADWLKDHLPQGGIVGFDPWHYTAEQIEVLEKALTGSGITLQPTENLIDRIWPDQPAPPQGAITPYPADLAGNTHDAKRTRLAASLKDAGHESAVITPPDSIAWLLNIRGRDIPRNPVAHAFAILHDNGHLTLFTDPAKVDDTLRAHLGDDVVVRPPHAFGPGLRSLTGPVRLDKTSVPLWVVQQLDDAGVAHHWGDDPCVMPKACKTDAEIAATRAAHLRDGAAVCEFLAWFDDQPAGTITEIDVITKLEECRAATGKLLDISFDTIAGSGPHGALAHYRVTHKTNRTLQDGDLLVLDGGGQYLDGTTDITRTLPVGTPGADETAAFTRVLQGMIAMSRLRFPKGLAGRDLDVIARYPLWLADQDYNHGTGHGVGVHLCVHEGPQRLSRISEVPFRPGMIVSNEPGYYREGAFGIRIENLLVVKEADKLPGGDVDGKFCFETLNFVPIDRRLIRIDMLSLPERDWLNSYHAACRDKIGPRLSQPARLWLAQATELL